MSDWDDACDPVPAKEPELSPAEAARRRKRLARLKAQGRLGSLPYKHEATDFLEPAFDEMGA